MRFVRIWLFLVVLGSFNFVPSAGWAYLGGGGDGGCCNDVPKELVESAIALRQDFLGSKRQDLLDHQLLGKICEKFNCGELTEAQADKLLDRFFLEQDRVLEEADKSETRWLGRFGFLLGALGILLSFLAYRQSRAAEMQSVKNEVEIEHLKEKPAERIAG